MMVDYLGEEKAAASLLEAIKSVTKNDLKSMEAGKMGFSTQEVGDLVVGYL